MANLASLLRQPVMHFLVGGALLFLAYDLVANGTTEQTEGSPARGATQQILVTRGQVESLSQAFTTRWRRSPTDEELAGLIAEHVREEAMVREAVALGLDQGDSVIRRQLRLKMEFLAQDVGALGEPSEAELGALLGALGDRLGTPERIGFRHVFLDSARRGEAAALAEAATLLAALNGAGGDALAEEAGDRFLPGYVFRPAPAGDIARTFGGEVTDALMKASAAAWFGPVRSAYGVHLLRVNSREAARVPSLEEAGPALRAEWTARRRRESLDAFVAGVVKRFAVSIEGGPAPAVPARP